MTKVICCASGKGGVGKTTSSINLGLALNKFGKEVAVLDGNITMPNVGLYLGVHSVPISVHHVLSSKMKLSDAVYSHKSGLKVIPGDLSVGKLNNLKLDKLKTAVADVEGMFDYLIIDAGAGLGKEVNSALNACDQVLIVTNPEMAAITDALKTIQIAKKMKKQILGIVLTRFKNDQLDMGLKEIENILEYPVIGVIPEDHNVRKAMVKGVPVLNKYPKSESSLAYKKLAAGILGVEFEEESKPPTKRKESLIQDLLRIFKI